MRNLEYLEKKINSFDEIAFNRKISVAKDFLKIADDVKKVFQKYDGKKPTKRIESELQKIDSRLIFRHDQNSCFWNRWELTLYEYKNEVSPFTFLEMDVVDSVVLCESIDKCCGWMKDRIEKMTKDKKELKKKLKRLAVAADELNAAKEDFHSYTLNCLNINLQTAYI